MNGLRNWSQGVGFVLRMLLIWVELSDFLLCLISFVLRLQDNFCSFVAIELIPTKIWNSSQHLCRCCCCILLIITSPIDPFLKMAKYSLSYHVSVHNYCSLSSISLTLLGQLPMSISGNYGLGQPHGALRGIWRPFPRSYNPPDPRTQNNHSDCINMARTPISCFLR
jgi:hypothetical protein